MMNLFPYSEEHLLFRRQVRSFIDKEIRPFVETWEENELTPKDIWKRCGELGFLGAGYPEEVGGSGGDQRFAQIFCEEMGGCGSSGVCLGIMVQTHMATPILFLEGSDYIKENYLKPALRGEMLTSIAVTEPDCGSDVAGLRTKAVKDGKFFKLNGSKMFVTNGTQSDFLTLLARTSDEEGYNSFSLFVVPTNLRGIDRKKLKKTCYPSSDTALITFSDVLVPEENLIGEEGKGFQYQMKQFQHERLAACHMMVGTMKRAYKITKKYTKERNAFGKILCDHQVTRHKLAQMHAEITMIESLAIHCTDMALRGEDFTKAVTMLKLVGGQLQQKVMAECVQIHGGYGLMQEFEVARYFRDSKLATIGGGSNEVMKEIISKMEQYN